MNIAKYIGIGANFSTWQFENKREIQEFVEGYYTECNSDYQKYTLSTDPYVIGVLEVDARTFAVIIADSSMTLHQLTEIFNQQDMAKILSDLKNCVPQA